MDIGSLHGSIELDDNTAPAYASATKSATNYAKALEDAASKAQKALDEARERNFNALGTAGEKAAKFALEDAKRTVEAVKTASQAYVTSGKETALAFTNTASAASGMASAAATAASTTNAAVKGMASSATVAAGEVTIAAAGVTTAVTAIGSLIVIGAAAWTAAIVGVGKALYDLGTYGSSVNDISSAFERLTGDAKLAADNLEAMRDGTQNLISDTKLMSEASELMRANVKMTTDDYKMLSKAATVLADEGLGSVEKGLNVITNALVKGRSAQLDAAIGKVDLVRAEKDYAAKLGDSSMVLTQTGKLEAHRLAYMAALKDHIKDATVQETDFAETIQQGWVALENWGAKLASSVAASPVVMGALYKIRDAFVEAFGTADELIPTIVTFFETYADLVAKYGPGIIKFMGNVFKWFKDDMLPVVTALGIGMVNFWVDNFERGMRFYDALVKIYNKIKEIASYLPKGSTILGITNPGQAAVNSVADAAANARAGLPTVPGAAGILPNLPGPLTAELPPLPPKPKKDEPLTQFSGKTQSLIDSLSGQLDKKALQEIRTAVAALNLEIGQLDLWPAREGDAAIQKWVTLGKQLSELRDRGQKLNEQEGLLANRFEMLALTSKKYTDVLPQLIKYSTAWNEVLKDKAARDEVIKWMDKVVNKFPQVTDLLKIGISVDWDPLGTAAEKAGFRTTAAIQKSADDAKKLYDEMVKSGRFSVDQLNAAWEDYEKKARETFRALHPEWAKLNDNVLMYGQALQQIGGTIGGFVGSMVSGIGSIAEKWVEARENAEKYRKMTTAQKGVGIAMAGAQGAMDIYGASGPEAGGTGKRLAGSAMAGASAGASIGLMFAGFTMGASVVVGALIGAAVGAVVAGVRIINEKLNDGRKAIIDYANTFDESMTDSIDGFTALHNKLSVLGETGEALWTSLQNVPKGDKEAAEEAIEKVKVALEAVDKATKQYGMTWKDLSDPAKRMNELYRAGNDLAGMFEILKRSGYDQSAIVRQMSGDLNQYIITTMDAGMKFPPAMAPILKTLIETKQISEEAAAAMLGISTTAVPAIADIEAAAGRYGLTLADLGDSVRKIQMDEQVEQIVADFELLTLAGVPFNLIMKDTTKMVTDAGDDFSKMSEAAQQAYLDAGGVVTEVTTSMRDQIQKLVTDSQKLGKPLDESLKPIVQQLIDAGGDNGLVDQFGNALTDVGQLEWKKPLAESIDDLIGKLDELIDSFTGPGGLYEAITGLPTINPGTGTAPRPPGEPTGGGATPRTPTSTTPGPDEGTEPRAGVQQQNITVELDGRTLVRASVDGMPDDLFVRGV